MAHNIHISIGNTYFVRVVMAWNYSMEDQSHKLSQTATTLLVWLESVLLIYNTLRIIKLLNTISDAETISFTTVSK